MLAEYINIFIICAVAATVFFGGRLRSFPSIEWLAILMNALFPAALSAITAAIFLIPQAATALSAPFWFFLKLSAVFYVLIWFRASWPRLRYDQLMDLGWKRLIPLALGALLANAFLGML